MVHVQYIEKLLSKISYDTKVKKSDISYLNEKVSRRYHYGERHMNTRKIGGINEEKSVIYLKQNSFQVIRQNYRCKAGEIDIIAVKENILRFIEVKYRKNDLYGTPLEAITTQKQKKIMRAASWFLMENPQFQNMQCSFDVMAVTDNQIEYIFNSFGVM